MFGKRQSNLRTVHKFTDYALMKFRPTYYQQAKQTSSLQQGMISKVSSILSNFLTGKFTAQQRSSSTNAQSNTKKNTQINEQSLSSKNRNKSLAQPKASLNKKSQAQSGNNKSLLKNLKGEAKQSKANVDLCNNLEELDAKITWQKNSLSILQKISCDTFLIGNENQVDLITISGIYQGQIDTEINWSLNIRKKINKLTIDSRKCLIALECDGQILLYRFDLKKIKSQPVFVNKAKLLGECRFMLFLRDSQVGVFQASSATIYQLEQNNKIRLIFNKKYGVSEQLQLFQILKPFDNSLNIFFTKNTVKGSYISLWRLQFEFKNNANQNGGFKSLLKIYDIPKELLGSLRIDNYSKNIFIMNFKFQILAAKDGYIIDSANTNIQSIDSFLIYQNEHLLHVSQSKLHIYSFKILTNSNPNKISITSVDSIQIPRNPQYVFLDCLQMLNGNYVLFYQIDPRLNHKLKGEIEYLICATCKISVEEKLRDIFKFKSPDQLKEIAENEFFKIQQKCDIAFKIGLTRKQVYLQLWNFSNKRDIQDYKFLLDTMDYQTVKIQIQKKLKKSSMTFNQVYKLERSCFDILRTDLFSSSACTEQSVRNYLISHFLLRKLVFFRSVQQMAKKSSAEQGKVLTINIQQYFYCVNMDLKSCLLDYAFKICFEQKDCSQEMRLFINCFKFSLRLIYLDILTGLILQCRDKLINLLVVLPEILPYSHREIPQGQDLNLYEGLWSKIKQEEWKQSLHLEEITTIYNKQLVQEITKTVWFKRNLYTLHDLVAHSKAKIIELQQQNNEQVVLYHFIDQIFVHIKAEHNLNEIIEFIQINYELLPSHLKGKIFLYKKLFDYFKAQKYYSPTLAHFNIFLRLKDYELFGELFKYEKIKKGCLLKDAKGIYASIANGKQLYDEGLLNYFKSELSEISDLKAILNRLNNEKRQFHIENQSIYEVLVKAMQMKLTLGSEDDVPFEEVMIYVENIPFSKNNPIIEELNTIQIIGECSEIFTKIKLNMSFLEIVEKCEDVLSAMIDQHIKERNVLAIRDVAELKEVSYAILAEIQTIKEKIYKDKLNNLAYFIYISRLMEEQHLIQYARMLLEDQYLLQYYSVDDKIVQNLVIYMYRWKLMKEPAFLKNEQYLYELLTLLPQDNMYKIYFQAEIQFSITLSTPQHPIQFRAIPIDQPSAQDQTKNENLITTKQIVDILNNLPAQFVAGLNLQRVHQLTKTIQQLSFTQDNYLKMTSLVQIYEAVIIRLIKLKSIRLVLPKIKKLIQLYGQEQNYSIVFCYIILHILMTEIAENHKKNMAKIAFYTFNHPLKLLDIIQQLITSKFSNDQQTAFINEQLSSVKPYKCYTNQNFLLEPQMTSKIKEKEQRYYPKLEELIFQTWMHINNNRDDFSKNMEYTFFYICLIHNPYCLAKFLHILRDAINIRVLRSYLSYVFREQIFSGIKVLYFSRRMFIAVLDSVMEDIPIEFVISQYRGIEVYQNQIYPELPPNIEQINPFAAKLAKSIRAFSNKIESLNRLKPEQNTKKRTRIEALLSSEASINELEHSEYPFNDSDDNYDEEQVPQIPNYVHSPNKVKRKPSRIFDANRERKMLMERKDKNLFLSCNDKEDFQIRRNSSSNYLQNLMKSVQSSKTRNLGDRTHKLSGILDRIERADSNPLEENSLTEGLSRTHDDFLVSNLQPFVLQERPSKEENAMVSPKSLNPFPKLQKQFQIDSPTRIKSMNQKLADNVQQEADQQIRQDDCDIKININIVDDEQYTPVWELARRLLKEQGANQAKATFNLSLVETEKQKDIGSFEQYLKQLILFIYQSSDSTTSSILALIKQIAYAYTDSLQASLQFVQYYICLQSYNIKYKYNLPIRQMFPIEAIFLKSTDPKTLFEFCKTDMLKHVDFGNILLVAKLLHFALKRSEIKDELYFAYICLTIDHYGNDEQTAKEELLMQKQRIGGILDQITSANILVERGQLLLMKLNNRARKAEILQLIKDSLLKRKKNDVFNDFCRKFVQA